MDISDAPATQTKERTMECRHWNSSYKVCKVKDAQKVRSIEKIAQFPITTGSQCNKGIDYGIIEDSMWINNGCNGIYKVEYYSGKRIKQNENSTILLRDTPLPLKASIAVPAPTEPRLYPY